MEEKKLVQLLQQEQTKNDAFRQLVKQYKEQIYRFTRKIVIEHQDTDEVVQLTFIKVFKYISGFKGDSKLLTWMMTIARNEAYGFLQKKATSRQVTMDELSRQRMNEIKVNSLHYTGNEIELKLQKAVAQLPQKQREVFNMKYYDTLKFREISEITGTSESGLKTNYHLAVKRLKELLVEEDISLKS